MPYTHLRSVLAYYTDYTLSPYKHCEPGWSLSGANLSSHGRPPSKMRIRAWPECSSKRILAQNLAGSSPPAAGAEAGERLVMEALSQGRAAWTAASTTPALAIAGGTAAAAVECRAAAEPGAARGLSLIHISEPTDS